MRSFINEDFDSCCIWHARPTDIKGIVGAVEAAVDHVLSRSKDPWCDEEYRLSFSGNQVARRFSKIIGVLK